MKIIKYQQPDRASWGILYEEKIFSLEGDRYGEFNQGKEICSLKEVRLLAPVEPTIMVCCGMNYMERFREDYSSNLGLKPTAEPVIFFKPPSAVVGPMQDVIFLPIAETLRYEAELCVVIKRRARNVPEREAGNYILGYTCGNELGAMDLMKRDRWMTRAKGFDTSACLGPWVETDLQPGNLAIRSWVNGEKKQDSHTRFMIFSVEKLISFISEFMTLRPGDIIFTGSPEGACNVNVGDVMEIEIEGIGILKNKVVRAER
jgi:2-keto-4-pentenoate hydratase/2-oxohepta-3-ene-1,7-dioic acid hydratase in catechol pathway